MRRHIDTYVQKYGKIDHRTGAGSEIDLAAECQRWCIVGPVSEPDSNGEQGIGYAEIHHGLSLFDPDQNCLLHPALSGVAAG